MDATQPHSTAQHTGLFVVILGPDGSGKSTVVERLLADSRTPCKGSWCFHWRPGLLPQPGRRAKQPSPAAAPPPTEFAYGRMVSLLRYCYFLTDFVLGYWLLIYPRRKRGQLIIGERWYYDVLISPQRYGFKLPAWLLRFGGHLIPAPDLTLLLKADPVAIHARKPELTVAQITSQITAMQRILPGQPLGAEVSTDLSIDESVTTLLMLLQEASGRLRGASVWRAFPRVGNAKVLIAGSDPVRVALQLYNPYSLAGRTVKRLAGMLPRVITTRCLTAADQGDRIKAISRLISTTTGDDSLDISFATGTPGPHRKMTAQVRLGSHIMAYVKVAESTAAIDLIKREAIALNNLKLQGNGRIATPVVIAEAGQDSYQLLILSAPETAWSARPVKLDTLDVAFIDAMMPASFEVIPLNTLWETCFAAAHSNDDIVQATRLALETLTGTTGIRVAPSHGDYAPWNTLNLDDGRLFVFDWEYFNSATPLLGDLFQRIFMPNWLVHRLPPAATVDRLIQIRTSEPTQPLIKRHDIDQHEFNACLLLYLLRQGFRNADERGIPDYIRACLQCALSQK